MSDKKKVAVVGGTGHLGALLARRFYAAGYDVIIGSRDKAKAEASARSIEEVYGNRTSPAGACADAGPHDGFDPLRDTAHLYTGSISGAENKEACRAAEVIVVSVPYAAQADILASIRDCVDGKPVVVTSVPLDPGNPTSWVDVPDGSAAEEAARILGPESKVVAAFENLSMHSFPEGGSVELPDVLICGDDAPAKAVVSEMCESIGLRGIDAGPLKNARVIEKMTPVLIGINKRMKKRRAGIRITGI
ncbi:MAG TPA: NAD(P)-binding domain-containing protein [Clostridia bacterium]|nr:NAD(P)-binding domain-containing protein [Clostridia bacterium]